MTDQEMRSCALRVVSQTIAAIEAGDRNAPGGEGGLGIGNKHDYFEIKKHAEFGPIICLADSAFDAMQDDYESVLDGLSLTEALELLKRCEEALADSRPLPPDLHRLVW